MKLIVAIALASVFALASEYEIYTQEPHVIPHELPPIMPLPPVEASQCERSYVCDSNGNNCKWIVICN